MSGKKRYRSTKKRIRAIVAIVNEEYQPGDQNHCYKAIWRRRILPEHHRPDRCQPPYHFQQRTRTKGRQGSELHNHRPDGRCPRPGPGLFCQEGIHPVVRNFFQQTERPARRDGGICHALSHDIQCHPATDGIIKLITLKQTKSWEDLKLWKQTQVWREDTRQKACRRKGRG